MARLRAREDDVAMTMPADPQPTVASGSGLREDEARARLRAEGPNELHSGGRRSLRRYTPATKREGGMTNS